MKLHEGPWWFSKFRQFDDPLQSLKLACGDSPEFREWQRYASDAIDASVENCFQARDNLSACAMGLRATARVIPEWMNTEHEANGQNVLNLETRRLLLQGPFGALLFFSLYGPTGMEAS